MESLKTLEQLNNSLTNRLAEPVIEKNIDEEICNLTSNIKKEFEKDYSTTLKFKPMEKELLEKMFIDYLVGRSDDFNTHYIQLLAWNLIDIKVMPSKNSEKQSIFEYSPNPLAPYTVIEKTFKLFQEKRIDPEKISYALILNYLNNYKIASNRYKSELKKYLKAVKFSENLNIYFNVGTVVDYTIIKTNRFGLYSEKLKKYPEYLKRLELRKRTLDTVYFSDAWFLWMLNYANLTDMEYVLENLNCNFFKICNEDKKKIIFAKIICDNGKSFGKQIDVKRICENYVFPLIKKGDPLKKEYWNLGDTSPYYNYKYYLEYAWFFIEQSFLGARPYNHINFEA